MNQEILKVSKNNHDSWEALQLISLQFARINSWHSASHFIYNFVFHMISDKTV